MNDAGKRIFFIVVIRESFISFHGHFSGRQYQYAGAAGRSHVIGDRLSRYGNSWLA